MMLSVLLNSMGFVIHVDFVFENVSWSRLCSRDSVVPSTVRSLSNWFILSIGSLRSLFGQASLGVQGCRRGQGSCSVGDVSDHSVFSLIGCCNVSWISWL